MATSKPKDSGTNVGKKALTPSNSHTRTSTFNSTQKASSTDNNNQKQVPNYLKPTISSRPNSFKHPKNQDSHSNKPTLNRRRSFDKPPSPSGSSLAPRKAGAERAGPALRNSSFSTKTTTTSSLRTLSSKTLTAPRAAKPQTLYAKSTKKGTGSFVRKEKGPTKSSGATKVINSDDDHDQELVKVTSGDELIKSEASSINQDHFSDTDHEHEHEHEQDQDQNSDERNNLSESCDISTVLEELVQKADHDDHHDIVNHNAGFEETSTDIEHNNLDIDQEQVEVVKPGDNNDHDHVQDSDHLLEDDQETNNQLKLADHDHDQEAKADEHDHDHDQVLIKEEDIISNEGVIATEGETGDDQQNKTTDIVDNHDDHVNDHQKEEEDGVVEEVAKPAVEPSAGPAAAAVLKRQGKKESQAYNDVIEETASKLLEKRKNKVKALVGAFETVIDYESAAK